MPAHHAQNRPLAGVIIYCLAMALILALLHAMGLAPGFRTETLLRFDALHYAGIMQNGYASESSAFFPLFPTIWRLSHLGAVGISLLNGLIFLVATALLVRELRTDLRAVLVFMSLPCMFFLFVPYTEATFFTGAALLLVALRRQWPLLAATGLLWSAMARPSFTALLPALIITIIIGPGPAMRKAGQAALYTAACLVALLVVIMVQSAETGDPWGFYKAQAEFGNTFKLPGLPLTSWAGGSVVRLDAVALLAGVACAVVLLNAMRKRYLGKPSALPAEVLLSAGYVAGIAAIALLLRGGSLYSLNRFIFATPFALVLIAHYVSAPQRMAPRTMLVVFLAVSAYFLLFASFVHIQTFLWFSAIALHVTLLLFALGRRDTWGDRAFIAWMIAAVAIQVFYVQRYLNGLWVA